MKKFHVKYQRDFQVEISAETAADAKRIADHNFKQYLSGTCKLLSIIAEDAVVEGYSPPFKPQPPRGGPGGGGSSGIPVARAAELSA